MSLRRNLLVSILSGVIAVVALSGVAVLFIASAGLREQFDRALLARARTFAALVVDEPVGEDPDEVGGLVLDYTGSLAQEDLGMWLRITDDEGKVLMQSPDWPTDSVLQASPGAEINEPTYEDVALAGGESVRRLRMFAHAMEDDGDELDPAPLQPSERWVIVELLGPTDSLEREEGALLMALLIGGVCAAGGTAIAVSLGVRWSLRPIGRLSESLDQIAGDVSGVRLDRGAEAVELAPMVAAINGLLERLRRAMERERRFTDAVAHELRTPIAELRAIAEVAERWPEPERLQKGMREALAVANEIHSLIESLLAAAREQGFGASDECEDLALLPTARALVKGWVESCGERDVEISLAGDERATWNGPRGAIVSLLRNLVDNAAEYTRDGGSLAIRVAATGAGAQLEIENGPVELTQEQVDHMFEPFWRGAPVRGERSHRGLGLFVAQSLAHALGLQCEATLVAEGGLRVRVSKRSIAE